MRWPGNYLLEWLRGPWPELVFIRHGHSCFQLAREMKERGLIQSPRDAFPNGMPNYQAPLTLLGQRQAELTGQGIRIIPDAIYTSQMQRARETAEYAFPGYKHLMRFDPRLNEKNAGPADLMSVEEIRENFPLYYTWYKSEGKYFASKAPGGQTYAHLFFQLHGMLDTCRRDHANEIVVIVCHSAIMAVARQLFENLSPVVTLNLAKEEWLDNCSILHYRQRNGGGWRHAWGWSNGKFRLELVRSPYELWSKVMPVEEKDSLWQASVQSLNLKNI